MQKILALLLAITPLLSNAQEYAPCDSIFIDCCSTVSGPDAVMITMDNQSSVLGIYPGLRLLDSNQNIVATEEVVTFDWGSGLATHSMDIITPITLPFDGTVEFCT
jgi:hypothetical protein